MCSEARLLTMLLAIHAFKCGTALQPNKCLACQSSGAEAHGSATIWLQQHRAAAAVALVLS